MQTPVSFSLSAQMSTCVPLCVTPESGCPYCACLLPAAPDDQIEVYVKRTPAGTFGLFAIRGRTFVPPNQATLRWNMGAGSRYAPFYINVRPGKQVKHAVYLFNALPATQTVGLSPDGYGWLQFSPADIEERLKSVETNTCICLH